MGRSVFEYYEDHLERSTFLEGIDPPHLYEKGMLMTALMMIGDGIRALQAYCLASAGAIVILESQKISDPDLSAE